MNSLHSIFHIPRSVFSIPYSIFHILYSFLRNRPWTTSWIILALAVTTLTAWTLLLPLSEAHGAYTIQKSLRFNDNDSAYLSKTFGGAPTSKRIGTFSAWVKRANISTQQLLLGGYDGSSSNAAFIEFDSSNRLGLSSGGSAVNAVTSTALFRDPSAWMHVVVAWDTTQATAANRVSIYVNGTKITAFDATNYPAQNFDMQFVLANANNRVGTAWNQSLGFLDAYLSDIYFVDGQALGPENFAETDATTGTWKAKAYTGTYGTNGFHLDFTDSSTLGNDVSGNNNDWTANNLDATDQVRDTPTNNFATINVLDKHANVTLSNGNLKSTLASTADSYGARASFAVPSTGKWYWEVYSDVANYIVSAGIADYRAPLNSYSGTYSAYMASFGSYDGTNVPAYGTNCTIPISGGGCGGTVWSVTNQGNGDTLMVAYDADNGKLWYGRNGTWYSSGGSPDPATGSDPRFSGIASSTTWHPRLHQYWTPASIIANFGQGGTTTATYSAAAGGSFKYAPPQGFKALSSNNLPTPTISNPKNYFDALTYNSPVLLLHADGTDASTSFTDSSTAARAFTVNGDSQIDTAQSKFGGASALFDGTGDYISVPDNVDFAFGTGDFTIDFWLRRSETGTAQHNVFGQGNSGLTGGYHYGKIVPTTSLFTFAMNDDTYNASSLTAINDTNWHHIAVVRSGNSLKVALDGVFGSAVDVTGITYTDSPGVFGIGQAGDYASGSRHSGWIDEFRVSKGIARWTSNFTPPTEPYSANTISGLNFQPSLTWIKDRTSAVLHGIFDAVRKTFPYLSTNATTAETSSITGLTEFESDGFALGSNSLFNTNTNNYISWNWKEDPAAGFDIVTYTGNGANRTISHSLGKTPGFMIVKDRAGANDWAVYIATSTTEERRYLLLNSTAAIAADSTYWNNTAPTASVFSLGTNADVNTSGRDYVAYLFASTTGYSKFGNYTGNGSTDGPFVYTGFKPRFIMLKRTDSTSDWRVYDTARIVANPADDVLEPNTSDAEDTGSGVIDILSNGFKLRDAGANNISSTATYIYAAFAENPFKEQSSPYNLTIASSTRFNDDDSAYLNRTFSDGDGKTWTASFWVKPGNLGTARSIFNGGSSANDYNDIRLSTDDKLYLYRVGPGGGTTALFTSSAVFRDPSTWHHIVVQMDSTQATAADRLKLWVNGIAQTFSTANYPSLNYEDFMNNATTHNIGRLGVAATNYMDGYLSDMYFIGGQALTPSSFGETDTNGIWRPKTYSGSYGTNGFHLPLMGTSTAAGIGIDTSGNNNNWTVNNIDTTDFVKDSPTNNFAVLNSVEGLTYDPTLSQGNLRGSSAGITSTNATTYVSTIDFDIGGSTGFYAESTIEEGNTVGANWNSVGVILSNGNKNSSGGAIQTSDAIVYQEDGAVKVNGSTVQTYSTYGPGDFISVAVKSGSVWFGKNGTWNGNPSAGTGAAVTGKTGSYRFAGFSYLSGGTDGVQFWNFGQGGQSGLSYHSTAGGYFKYTPPTDFKALSTDNLPSSSIPKPNNYFDAKTYTGTGAATSTWSGFLNFQPALVWIKDRTSANAHGLFDSVRAAFPYLSSDATGAETASTTALTSFASNSFTLGASSIFNKSSNRYISWNWLESSTAGFDIVSYTGTGANRTISHSLSSAPEMIIVKDRSGANDWAVYIATSTTEQTRYLLLNSTAAITADSTYWNNTAPTASVFSLGTNADVNTSGNAYVAYAFDEISGYSDFGSYTGNGNADGPFVYTGFKPRFIMFKKTSATSNWSMIDTARDSYNVALNNQQANNASADSIATATSGAYVDVLSNGFKLRGTSGDINDSSATYIYVAFAESPFKYSTAGSGLLGSSASPFIFMEF